MSVSLVTVSQFSTQFYSRSYCKYKLHFSIDMKIYDVTEALLKYRSLRQKQNKKRNKQFFGAVAGILSRPWLKLHVMCKNISHINPHFNLTKKVTEHVQSTNMPLMVQRHWSLEKNICTSHATVQHAVLSEQDGGVQWWL